MSQIPLFSQISLNGSGFTWMFKFGQVDQAGFISGQMDLTMQTVQDEKSLGNVQFSSKYSDLEALADYLDDHVQNLIKNPETDAKVFVQYGLEYQLQALCGELEPDGEGDFGLRIMLLAGQTQDGDRVHIGVEGSVDVAHCRSFVAGLRALLKSWPTVAMSNGSVELVPE